MENSSAGLKKKDLELSNIKSYVLRSGRITEAQKEALVRLYPLYSFEYKPQNFIEAKDILNAKAPFIIEIGFGMGQATVQIAKSQNETAFLGIEVHAPGVGKVLAEIKAQELNNLKLIKYDAIEVLSNMIGDKSIDGFNIFFPDPWPKKRHHKRRLINEPFIKLLLLKLKAGGYIYFVTDWEDYAENCLELFNKEKMMYNKYESWAPRQEWRPITKFEKRAIREGRAIRELFFLKH